MKIEAKRTGAQTLPRTLLKGSATDDRSFDGYSFVQHFKADDGRDVRVIFDRHEAERFARFVADHLASQRAALADLRRVTDALV